MPAAIRRRYDAYRTADLTWLPGQTGKPSLFCWNDHTTADLGPDPDGGRFDEICSRMLGGRFYPSDAIEFFGRWMDERRPIRVGDRILQRARLLPFSKWPVLWAMTEAFVAETTGDSCSFGYLTTQKHFGRGIWKATLRRVEDGLELDVDSISGPQSWLFWAGLPVARYLQLRARRRAIEVFRALGAPVGGDR